MLRSEGNPLDSPWSLVLIDLLQGDRQSWILFKDLVGSVDVLLNPTQVVNRLPTMRTENSERERESDVMSKPSRSIKAV